MTALVALLNWRPRTPFYYGWLVIGMAALATFAATGVSQVVMSGVQGFILEDLDWDRSTIALAATAGTWTAGVITPFVGRLTDRYGPRLLMPIGVIIVGISYISLSGSHSIWQFYLAFILGRAMSNPVLIGVVPRTAAVNFFQRKRNMVLAMTSMSRPIGGAINIQIISAIAVSSGWRTAYRYLGIMSFLLPLPLMVIMRRRPEDIGLLPDGAIPGPLSSQPSPGRGPGARPAGPGQIGSAGEADAEFSWTAGEALRTRAFWLVAASAALGTLGASTIGFSMVLYLQDKAGISEANAARVLSISTLMALTNLGWGYLADRYGPRPCFLATLLFASATIIYLFTVNSLPAAYAFGLLWGLFTSSVGVMENMLLAQYYGRDSYGSISGTLGPIQTAALGLGPSLGALAYTVTGSYTGINGVMVGAYLLAAVLIFLGRPPALPSRAFATASTKTR